MAQEGREELQFGLNFCPNCGKPDPGAECDKCGVKLSVSNLLVTCFGNHLEIGMGGEATIIK